MNTMPHLQPENLTSTRTLAFSLQPPAFLGAALLSLALLLAGASPGLAQSPSAINYQGVLTDNLGKPLSSGVYQVQFKIWNSANDTGAGSYIWGRTFPIHVATNGMFNVVLDNSGSLVGAPKTNSILDAFGDPDRWLGLSIVVTPDGKPVTVTNEISPRQRLVSAPFAIHSYDANTAFLANRSYYAGTATNAYNAGNATNFANMSTNDFLWVKKASQDLTGNLSVQGTFNANGKLTVSNAAPIEIRSYSLPSIADSDHNGIALTNTAYSTNLWSATVVGWHCHANVLGTDNGRYMVRAVANASGFWTIELGFFHSASSVHDIIVDAMFIRKELVRDFR